MKVSWTEHKTNEEVLQMVDTEREMMDTLRSRQKRRLGHILRHDSLLRIRVHQRFYENALYKSTYLLTYLLT